jgi:hypothetical protein
MPKRKITEITQPKVRMREELRSRLEREAKRKNISLNAEIVDRLTHSFNHEAAVEAALGGPEGRRIAMHMVSAFNQSGAETAYTLGHPEWSAAEWMNDPQCYRAAVWAVLRALILAQPKAEWTRDEVGGEFEEIKSHIASVLVRAGKLKME